MIFNGFDDTFSLIVKEIVGFLTLMGVVVEIAPIKIRPLTFIFKWVGSALFKETNDELRKLRNDFTNHELSQFRKNILDFSNSCMQGVRHTKEEFDYIMGEHTKYETITEVNKIPNHQVDLAFRFIEECYIKCQHDNDFL